MMGKLHNNEQGFGAVEGILIVVIVALIGFVGWYVWHNKTSTDKTTSTTTSNTAPTNTTTTKAPSPLAVGDFGSKGGYGTFQAEGYAKTIKKLGDTTANCGMSNPGVDCPKIDGVYFTLVKIVNTKAQAYIKTFSDPTDNSFLLGCPADGTIKYDNSSDAGYKSYVISKDDTTKLLAATSDKPIRLEITKLAITGGKDAVPCYSQFATYKIISD